MEQYLQSIKNMNNVNICLYPIASQKWHYKSITLFITVILTLSFTVTFSNGSLYAQAQTETFPNSVFAGTTQANLHELRLKAKSVNGQTTPASGFKSAYIIIRRTM